VYIIVLLKALGHIHVMYPSAFNKTMIYTKVLLPHTCMYPSAFNKTMIYTKVVLRHTLVFIIVLLKH
jgi:hypothetical protein